MDIGTVRQIDIGTEMQGAYLDYAMSVIVARALPDVRDGLKPVQRRVLYAMYDMGLRHDRPYKKSARIVGEVLGKYHPHGDMAVYEAMVRMAQDFSMRCPLVDGQGNFGSVDGDSAAAMRYSEARLTPIAAELLADIEKETVDFADNFDGTLKEPSVLPSAFPNLLVNGSAGIAVGMSTNIPPHNLGEICAAIAYLIDHYRNVDDIAVEDLLKYVKGPDFPTGGLIYRFRADAGAKDDAIQRAYATGRGQFFVQARAHIEELARGRSAIIVTELPYQVNKSSLVERIAELVRDGRIEGIADLRDESDRQGIRLVIEVSRTGDADQVLEQLYRLTPMRSTFSVILLALVDGEPKLLPLKRALQLYIEHRRVIITRRSEHDLKKAQERAHILEGLRSALAHLDEVIQTIRKSPDSDVARQRLMKRFKFSLVQAQAILDMPLKRLAALERQKIEDEYKETRKLIAHLKDLLAHPQKILSLIKDNLLELKAKYSDPRRTLIVETQPGKAKAEDLVPDAEVLVTLTPAGYIYRTLKPGHRRRADKGAALAAFARNRAEVLLLTQTGRAFRVPAHQLPDVSQKEGGAPLGTFVALEENERVIGMAALPLLKDDERDKWYLVTATRQGKVKRTTLAELCAARASGTTVMKIEDGDEVAWGMVSDGAEDILLVASNGQAIRFAQDDVRPMGLAASGVMGIKLGDEDVLVGAALARRGGELLVLSRAGWGKRTGLREYPRQGRYGTGVRTAKITARSGPLAAACVVCEGDDVLVSTRLGSTMLLPIKDVARGGRQAQGRVLLELKSNDTVTGLSHPGWLNEAVEQAVQ